MLEIVNTLHTFGAMIAQIANAPVEMIGVQKVLKVVEHTLLLVFLKQKLYAPRLVANVVQYLPVHGFVKKPHKKPLANMVLPVI